MAIKNDLIQVNENLPEWCGCVMIADEIKPNGVVLARMKVHNDNIVFLRLTEGQYELVGHSKFEFEDYERCESIG